MKDSLGRTPLHVGINSKNKGSIICLLLYHANPFIKDNNGLNCYEFANNTESIRKILGSALSLNFIEERIKFMKEVKKGNGRKLKGKIKIWNNLKNSYNAKYGSKFKENDWEVMF